MNVRKGSRVRYKVGSGYAVGKVTRIKGDRAVIETASKGAVTRKVENLCDPDGEDEPAAPFDTVAPTVEVLNRSQVDEGDLLDTEPRADWEDTFRPRDVVKLPPENGHGFDYEPSEDDEDVDEGDDEDDFVEPDGDGDEDDFDLDNEVDGDEGYFDSDEEGDDGE